MGQRALNLFVNNTAVNKEQKKINLYFISRKTLHESIEVLVMLVGWGPLMAVKGSISWCGGADCFGQGWICWIWSISAYVPRIQN